MLGKVNIALSKRLNYSTKHLASRCGAFGLKYRSLTRLQHILGSEYLIGRQVDQIAADFKKNCYNVAKQRSERILLANRL